MGARNSIPLKQFEADYKNKQLRNVKLKKGYDYLTTKEVAKLLNVTAQQARNMCCGGHFEGAFKIGTAWRIPMKRDNSM